jgi:hypothetical protein
VPSLEQIVRPFVVFDTTPPRIPLASAAAAPQPNVIINIGLGGKAKTISTGYSVSASFYQDKYYYEIPTGIILAPGQSYQVVNTPEA